MKLCKDCRYFQPSMWCHHPNNGISLVDGSANPEFCHLSRKDEDKCGESAKWFEPIEIKPKRKWWKLWEKK